MKAGPLERFSPAALAALLCFGILTLWVRERWALGVYQAGSLLLAALWTAGIWRRPRSPGWGGRLAAAGALAGAGAWGLVQLAAGTTVSRWDTTEAALDWFVRAALFGVASQALAGREPRRRFLDVLLYFGFGLSALAILQMFTSGGRIFWLFPSGYADLVMGPFVYRNQYAAFIEMVLPLALYRAATDRRGAFAHCAMAAVMAASVVAGASRAGTVLVLLEVLAAPALAWARGAAPARSAGLVLAWLTVLGAVVTAVVGWQHLWERFQQADPYAGRRGLVQSSVQMARDRPWTGFGLGAWSTAYPGYALYDDGLFANQAHNDWLQWGVEGGVPMLAAMLLFAAAVVRPALRSVWGVGLLAVLLHCVVDYPMQQRPALAGWFFAMAGAVMAAGEPDRAGKQRPGAGTG